MTKCYFVTGTDTEIGKTTSCIALLQAANLLKLKTVGYKPIATGSHMTSDGLRNKDAIELQNNSNVLLPYRSINPYTFIEPTSPHIASINEKKPISLFLISKGLHFLKKKADIIIIEGIGGWFTPIINNSITFADWVTAEKLPVILVVGIKLGCINHALLTAKAVKEADLHLVGWIANNMNPVANRQYLKYLKTLEKFLATSFLGEIPFLDNMQKFNKSLLGQYLDFKKLKI